MKKLNTILFSLALLAVCGFAISSCTPTSSPATTAGAPSGLMATSLSSTSIGITWTRDATNDVSADTVIVTGGSVTVAPILATAPGNTATISGLSAGTMYTISVHGTGGASASIMWETATRTASVVRVWDFATPASVGFSGLELSNASGQAVAVSLAKGSASTADFLLYDDATQPSGLVFQSADAYDSVLFKHSALSDTALYSPTGLDGLYTSMDLSKFNYSVGGAETSIPDDAVYTTKGWKIKLARTTDGHYAKIAIMPQTNGKLYGTDGSGNKFIDVAVSYQTTTDPYAARPHIHVNHSGGVHMTQ